jgi:osmotically-inducible protein OsmY
MRLKPLSVVKGLLFASAGAGLMYLLDPKSGRRRRALVADKSRHGANVAGTRLSATASDLGNRTRGLTNEAMSRFRNDETLTDDKLAHRVRSELGHHTQSASEIEVTAKDGCVVLSGPVLTAEAEKVVKAASKVRGVSSVENRLQLRETPAPATTPGTPSELPH